jgi:hypothetical protein
MRSFAFLRFRPRESPGSDVASQRLARRTRSSIALRGRELGDAQVKQSPENLGKISPRRGSGSRPAHRRRSTKCGDESVPTLDQARRPLHRRSRWYRRRPRQQLGYSEPDSTQPTPAPQHSFSSQVPPLRGRAGSSLAMVDVGFTVVVPAARDRVSQAVAGVPRATAQRSSASVTSSFRLTSASFATHVTGPPDQRTARFRRRLLIFAF